MLEAIQFSRSTALRSNAQVASSFSAAVCSTGSGSDAGNNASAKLIRANTAGPIRTRGSNFFLLPALTKPKSGTSTCSLVHSLERLDESWRSPRVLWLSATTNQGLPASTSVCSMPACSSCSAMIGQLGPRNFPRKTSNELSAWSSAKNTFRDLIGIDLRKRMPLAAKRRSCDCLIVSS